ncbi:tetratricopeptide repeat protein [Pedobacter sp. UYP30]|uniref:tetratricopeptide repeat protein n=1 Tax=Pedobacter sp. UYP30 TaxID=1756400 RepID=UPI003398C808
MSENRDENFHSAVVAFNEGQLGIALQYFIDALQSPFLGGNNNDGLILNNIATVYNKLGDYNNAVNYYERAIACGLRNEDIFFSLAIQHVHLRDNHKALVVYDMIVYNYPISGKAYYLRGKHHQRMKNFTKQNQDFGMAASLNYYG